MTTIVITVKGRKRRIEVCQRCAFAMMRGEEAEVDLCDECTERMILAKIDTSTIEQ